METSPTLRRSLLRYGHTFLVQIACTALANSRSKLETRLARWLLMAHDRGEGDELILTHEFLATMLGVRRPGVTVALNFLEKKGLVRVQRKTIFVIDRKGLEVAANHAYGAPEAEVPARFRLILELTKCPVSDRFFGLTKGGPAPTFSGSEFPPICPAGPALHCQVACLLLP